MGPPPDQRYHGRTVAGNDCLLSRYGLPDGRSSCSASSGPMSLLASGRVVQEKIHVGETTTRRHEALTAGSVEQPTDAGVPGGDFRSVRDMTDLVRHERLLLEGVSKKLKRGEVLGTI